MANFNQLTICHLIITSHKEVLFREAKDVGTFLNCIALAAYSTETRILADAEMSTHCHLGIISPRPNEFCRSVRIRYSRYFNKKYKRDGRFGETGCYVTFLDGAAHICTAISYILRNGLHHGISPTPFGYPYCSVNYLFTKDLGRDSFKQSITDRNEIASCLPKCSEFPDGYAMDSSGVFLRESFEEIKLVESLYVSARSFLYNMNRLSGEEWCRDQERDGNSKRPVTLQNMEIGWTESEMSRMLKAERGHSFINKSMDDFSLCKLVDNDLVTHFRKSSVYELSKRQRQKIADTLCRDLKVPAAQASRVLAMEYGS